MESLSMRELYARNTENQITSIKSKGNDCVSLVVGQLEYLRENRRNPNPDIDEVFDWVLSCFQGDTVQTEAEKLTEEQLLFASIVVSAVSDCATIDHYDEATTGP
jgi:hypothetical protein